jgi:hypothetical protein
MKRVGQTIYRKRELLWSKPLFTCWNSIALGALFVLFSIGLANSSIQSLFYINPAVFCIQS